MQNDTLLTNRWVAQVPVDAKAKAAGAYASFEQLAAKQHLAAGGKGTSNSVLILNCSQREKHHEYTWEFTCWE